MHATADGNGGTVSFLDLFSGIGAMRLGFESACTAMGRRPQCVGFSEIDGAAIGIYLRHFPDTPLLGDIRLMAASGAPACDVLLGGFPCQDASSAGKRIGLAGERGRLFFALADIIGAVRPSAFLLENVKGLVSLDGGKALQTILATLTDLGYAVSYAILNSRNFGVPQNRPRIYIIGFRDGDNGFQFPLPTDSTIRLNDILERDAVPARHYLTEHALERLRLHKARHQAKGNGFGYTIIDSSQEVAGTLMSSNWGQEKNLIVDNRLIDRPSLKGRKSPISRECIRKLTPIEWERLQGLPDGFTEGQADGHRYRQLGNAITVPVIRAVSRSLLSAMRRTKAEKCPAITIPGQVFDVGPVTLPLTAVELFAGCGGLSTGLELTRVIKVKVACELNLSAAETYRLNHPETVMFNKDLTTEEAKRNIVEALVGERCDLLVGGVPCQAYSLSGQRDPCDPRGSLFEHFIEMVRRLSPRVAVIENVRGILSMRRPDGLSVMTAISREFRTLGYAVGYYLLNAADFGDPQVRMRVVILGWQEGEMPEFEKTHDEQGRGGLSRWRTVRDAIGDLEDAPEDKDFWHFFVKSNPDFVERIRATPIGQSVNASYKEARYRNPPNQPAITIKENHGGVLAHYRDPRLMTPRELARLQSFPDSYRFHGAKGDVLRQIGNAVPVGLASAIGRAVLGMLGKGTIGQHESASELSGRP
jgi:DNA (cytosine-5)-methyltransferase 1